MVMAFGKDYMVIPISENGDIQKLRVMEYIPGKTEIDTKENGKFV